MSIYVEKAKELANLILESEQSKLLSEASATFKANEDAQRKMEDYNKYRANVQKSMQEGGLSKEEISALTQKLTEMTTELKQDPIIGALVFAENEFNGFVNNVMTVLKNTIMGVEDTSECSSGSCSSCSGC